MKFKSILAASILGILFIQPAFSQSEYLENGVSGFGYDFSFTRNSDAKSYGLALGCSVNGRMTLGMAWAYSKYTKTRYGGSFAVYTEVFALKECGTRAPFSFSALLEYAVSKTSGGGEDYGIIGGALYKDIPVTDKARFQFAALIGHQSGFDTYFDNSLVGIFGISFFRKNKKGNVVAVRLSYLANDYTTNTFTAGVGYTFQAGRN